jgi:hypothetical protein
MYLQRENHIRGSQNAILVCLPMERIYEFLPDTIAACKKGIFTIPSLCFQIIFKIVRKIEISDS